MSGGVSADTIAAAIAGLFAGAAGGLLTVVPITRLTERTKERRGAERAILASVNEYRARLVHDHDRLYRDSAYPRSYADIKGQERFALDVLREADHLSPKKRNRVRSVLTQLVGKFAVAIADKYVHLPAGVIDEAEEDQRQALELHKVLREQPSDARGLIGTVLRTQNESTAQADYAAALAALDRLRSLVDKRSTSPAA